MPYRPLIIALLLLVACTQETQNKLSRAVQNWTGTDGVLEIYAGEKLVKRFMKIDKISTAMGQMIASLVPTDLVTVSWMQI
jgi:hypothetical protein